MTRREVKILLLKEFLANFTDTIPVSFTNKDDFYFSDGTPTVKPTDSEWVRFQIKNNSSTQVSFGSEGIRKFGRYGIIAYQVFIPSGTGTDVGDSLCEDINDIFEGGRFQTIHCYAGSYSESGIQQDGSYMFTGTIFWTMDEVK